MLSNGTTVAGCLQLASDHRLCEIELEGIRLPHNSSNRGPVLAW